MTEKKQKTCFVIMPFADERWEVYKYAIEPACLRATYKPVRVDQLKGIFNINRKIIEHLVLSDVVVAELTDKNPNVFYEMGVAHAIDNKTIMMAQSAQDLPFDIRNYRCIIYKQSVEGLKKLEDELYAMLLSMEEWRQHPSNPVQDFKPRASFPPPGEWQRLQQIVQEQEAKLKKMVPATELQALQQALRQKEEALAGLRRDLKAKDGQLAGKEELLAKLERELQQLRQHKVVNLSAKAKLGPETTLHLRSQPIEKLEIDAIKQMLRERNFFASDWHKEGKGIAHQYERRADGQVVYDGATGLTWQQSGSSEPMKYKDAHAYIKKLNEDKFAGRTDWRLPTLEEAMSLMAPKKHGELYLDPVFDRKQRWIWTADTTTAGLVWVVGFLDGDCGLNGVDSSLGYGRAVF